MQLFEGVDYSTEAKKARDKELLRAKRMELIQDVSVQREGGWCGVEGAASGFTGRRSTT